MIRELSRKEYIERKPLLAIALTLVLVVTALIPLAFTFSLQHAIRSVGNETAQLVLINFRSYQVFLESEWLARNLARILCLLALIAGAGAIAGEREARTLPLLYTSSVRLDAVVVVKFCVIAVWLLLVTFASTAVLAAHSLLEKLPFPVLDITVASFVAWANAMAFLGVVFAASAIAKRTIVATVLALVFGFAMAGALVPLGLNGTALASNIFAVDGSIFWKSAWLDVLVSFGIVCLGMLVTFAEVERRRAT
ncbi:MAG: ABC transporter permease subunit [Candidatus Eremiobacteraeota bacterium]|nr:ABC transporter permease subunit [Candidatus Eremiobacteraeota bacterium]